MSAVARTLPRGSWPVMLTPFNEDHSIAWSHVDEYVEWLIERGSAGIFAVALAGEMYSLSDLECSALAARVVARSNGRVPVIASSTAGGSARQIVDSVARMADQGVDAVVLIPSLLARNGEPDATVRAVIDSVLDAVDDIGFGLYECPAPYHRLLSDEVLAHAAQSGRFTFVKDTTQSVRTMAERISDFPQLMFFNAHVASLTDTLLSGGAGFSGHAANVYPELVSWLCVNYPESDLAPLVQRLLTIAQYAIQREHPATAKYFLRSSSSLGFPLVCRSTPVRIDETNGLPLLELARHIAEIGELAPLLVGR